MIEFQSVTVAANEILSIYLNATELGQQHQQMQHAAETTVIKSQQSCIGIENFPRDLSPKFLSRASRPCARCFAHKSQKQHNATRL